MNKSRISTYLFPLLSLVIGGVCAILFATALGSLAPIYFSSGLTAALWIILGAFLLVNTILVFLLPAADSSDTILLHHRIASGIAATGTAFFAVYQFINSINLFDKNSTLSAVCLLLSAVFALAGVAYFFFPTVFGKRPNLISVLTGLSLILSMLLYVLHLYFDTTHRKNGSVKLFLALAFLAVVLYLLADMRNLLGRVDGKFYRIASPLTGVLSFMLAGGGIIYAIRAGAFPFGGVAAYVFLLVFFLYIYIGFLGDAANQRNNSSDKGGNAQ